MDNIVTRRVDHLLIVGHAMRRLRVRELIDARTPTDPRSRVSTGECVEALIVSILLGGHTLYLVHERLAPFDLRLAFGWRGRAEHFHDARLGKAMDAAFEAGITEIYAAFVLEAVRAHELDLSRVHLDTSTFKLFGRYEYGQEPSDPEDPQAVPQAARGHSKDHRPDLKQILFGVSVTADGAVPLFGRTASGNRSDPLEGRFILEQLARVLPNPADVTLVGDSKLFAGETFVRARKHRFQVLTLMPRSVGLWGEALAEYDQRIAAGLAPDTLKAVFSEHDQGSQPTPPKKLWRGMSLNFDYEWEDSEKGEKHTIPLRLLVVESSQLREQKTAAVLAQKDQAGTKLRKAADRLAKEPFKCAEDAGRAMSQLVDQSGSDFHVAHMRIKEEQVPARRAGRGRPPKDEPRHMITAYYVVTELEEDPGAIERRIREQSCFVLATTLTEQQSPNSELFRHYQEQNSVEGVIRWAKHPMAVAPVFLKTEERMAGLGLVYVLALMVYALIQREIRCLLEKIGDDFPGNKGRTRRPTTEVIFRLFEGIDALRTPDSQVVALMNMSTAQVEALRLLGHELLLDPRVQFGPLREPRRRMRGFREPKETETGLAAQSQEIESTT